MKKPPVIWLNAIVLLALPAFSIILIPAYAFMNGYDAFEWSMFFLFLVLTGLGITAGYHRLWSHRSYEAHPVVRVFLAFLGACGLQNSILIWSSDHRRHHKYVDDNEKDPYSAKKGFWYSHMGWILRDYHRGEKDFSNVKDLQRDPVVMWQHRNYLMLALLGNSVLLIFIGWLHGDLWGVFLLAGLFRIILNHHFTFFINSLAHIIGKQSYSEKNSSRDNMVLAFLTYGEGYHNYHHCFQCDYRNGIKWFHFDPTKWFIWGLSYIGLTSKLRKTPKIRIEKARLRMQYLRTVQCLEQGFAPANLKLSLEDSYVQFQEALVAFSKFKKEWVQLKKAEFQEKWEKTQLKMQYLELKAELRVQKQKWRMLYSMLSRSKEFG